MSTSLACAQHAWIALLQQTQVRQWPMATMVGALIDYSV